MYGKYATSPSAFVKFDSSSSRINRVFASPRKIRSPLPDNILRRARSAEKSFVFQENSRAIARLDVSPSNFLKRVGLDHVIFRYRRYLRKSASDFFTRFFLRAAPADSRRVITTLGPFGATADRIQGVRECHWLYREIFVAVPFAAARRTDEPTTTGTTDSFNNFSRLCEMSFT